MQVADSEMRNYGLLVHGNIFGSRRGYQKLVTILRCNLQAICVDGNKALLRASVFTTAEDIFDAFAAGTDAATSTTAADAGDNDDD